MPKLFLCVLVTDGQAVKIGDVGSRERERVYVGVGMGTGINDPNRVAVE